MCQSFFEFTLDIAQLAAAVEYINCFSADRYPPLHSNECPVYDTKQSDSGVPGMWSIPLLPLLPGQLLPRVVTPDRVLSIGQIQLNCVLMLNWTIFK